jgi:hypothetical protein
VLDVRLRGAGPEKAQEAGLPKHLDEIG